MADFIIIHGEEWDKPLTAYHRMPQAGDTLEFSNCKHWKDAPRPEYVAKCIRVGPDEEGVTCWWFDNVVTTRVTPDEFACWRYVTRVDDGSLTV